MAVQAATQHATPGQESHAPTPDAIMQLGTAFWGSKTLLSAVELELFTELAAAGPLDVEALRGRLGLHPRGARDFFDALVALGMLARDEEGYRNTPATDLFLDKGKPSYVGGLLEMANARLFGFWNSLTEGLRTGAPQNEAKTGGNIFDALYADQQLLSGFVKAMTGISMGTAHVMAAAFPWERYGSVIDVGCAEGCVPAQIASAHEHIGGGGFDLPPVQPLFEDYVARAGLGERLRFHSGDFFADPLPQADVLIMGHILHDWNADEKRTLLEKAHAALPSGGALIVYDAIIDDDRRENAFGLLMSLNMLIETEGGFDYTAAECQRWMREVGFSETEVKPLVGPDSMVVAIK
jgi:O-methyltransferase domain/Dimerisation domain